MKIVICTAACIIILFAVRKGIDILNRYADIPEPVRTILTESDQRMKELKRAENKLDNSICALDKTRGRRISKLKQHFWSSIPEDAALQRAQVILKELQGQRNEVTRLLREIDEKRATILIEAQFGHVITVDTQQDLKKQLETADDILVKTNRELNHKTPEPQGAHHE